MAYATIQEAIKAVFGSGWYITQLFSDTHHGIDIAAPIGKPIPALHEGTVVYSGFAGGGGAGYVHGYSPPTNVLETNKFGITGAGNAVIVQDANGIQYRYYHLSSRLVKVGDSVVDGNILGNVGDTGNATGSHLHFGIKDAAGHLIDPAAFLLKLGPITIHQREYNASPTDPITAAGRSIGDALTSVGYFIAFIFVGIMLLLVAALISRNSSPATA